MESPANPMDNTFNGIYLSEQRRVLVASKE